MAEKKRKAKIACMTNQQLYLAIGLPMFTAVLGMVSTIAVVLFQGKQIESRLAELRGDVGSLGEKVSQLGERIAALEVRVAHLEDA